MYSVCAFLSVTIFSTVSLPASLIPPLYSKTSPLTPNIVIEFFPAIIVLVWDIEINWLLEFVSSGGS